MDELSTKFEHISVNLQGASAQNMNAIIGTNITIHPPAPSNSARKPEGVIFKVRDSIATFKGREEIILQLHERIQKNQLSSNHNVVSQTTAICGMGGVGKTETVRKYIQIYRHDYTNIIWINAETYSEAKTCFIYLAERLKVSTTLTNGTAKEDRHLADEIYSILARDMTLIVFDNVQQPSLDAIKTSFFPETTSIAKAPCDVILTTREILGKYHRIDLGGLSLEESYDLLISSLKIATSDENYKAGVQIFKLSEGLPIVLQQVIGVIKKEQKMRKVISKDYFLTEYVTSVSDNLKDLIKEKPDDSSVPDSVFSIFQVSFERIKTFHDGKLALHCLDIMAVLSPDNIPVTLLKHLVNENNFSSSMSLLIDYNLVSQDGDLFRVHRMIQAIRRHSKHFLKVRDSQWKRFLARFSRQSTLGKQLTAFKEFLDETMLNDRNIFHALDNGVRFQEAFPMYNSGKYQEHCDFVYALAEKFKQVGRYGEAIKMFETFISVNQIKGQNQRLKTCKTIIQICECLISAGKYNGAEMNIKDTEFEYNKELDQHPIHRLHLQYLLAQTYECQGKYDVAEKMYKFVFLEETKLLGKGHEHTLTTMNNLASLYEEQGKREKAEEMYQFILQEQTKLLGEDHLSTLTTMHNLALMYDNQGKREKAEEMYQFILQEQTKLFGENHPSTLTTMNNLASLYDIQGKDEKAEEMYQFILQEQTKLLGKDHPSTLITMNNLAVLYDNQVKREKAEEMHQFILQEKRKLFGERHPSTLITMSNLATLYKNQRKYSVAEEMYKFVLQERTKRLGESHPDTLLMKSCLASLQSQLNQSNCH